MFVFSFSVPLFFVGMGFAIFLAAATVFILIRHGTLEADYDYTATGGDVWTREDDSDESEPVTEPATFEIVDLYKGTMVEEYENESEAREALYRMGEDDPGNTTYYGLVSYDEAGHAIHARTYVELFGKTASNAWKNTTREEAS